MPYPFFGQITIWPYFYHAWLLRSLCMRRILQRYVFSMRKPLLQFDFRFVVLISVWGVSKRCISLAWRQVAATRLGKVTNYCLTATNSRFVCVFLTWNNPLLNKIVSQNLKWELRIQTEFVRMKNVTQVIK